MILSGRHIQDRATQLLMGERLPDLQIREWRTGRCDLEGTTSDWYTFSASSEPKGTHQ